MSGFDFFATNNSNARYTGEGRYNANIITREQHQSKWLWYQQAYLTLRDTCLCRYEEVRFAKKLKPELLYFALPQ